ncbi:hypothetical protein TRFO_03252 [Tritrichomonas foetus]|uniref:Uncharacterized protein n=1 Tax=Tritrichomonas foetus TaxID=1144522 RepID=A0A1J4KVI2_9EUKA|nr:hypothetical protein TRFO_03252 [Tritrichomonas foetus]|eukprot:OHT13525.1 hypothetical protein TRFO_03252 [Tritrichomonas foetus]
MGKETWARQIGREKKPGPANYTTSGRAGESAPAYSIKSRYDEKGPPFAPQYVNLPTSIGESPRFTIRPQTTEQKPFDTPGPEYVPPRFGENYLRRLNGTMRSRGLSLDPRQRTYKIYDHDPYGPGGRDTRYRPNDNRAPAYKIGESNGTSWIRYDKNPSGAHYNPNPNYTKPSIPKYSIYSIHPQEEGNNVPGPGEYDTKDEFGKRPLAVRPRTSDLPKFQTPGPGQYENTSQIGQDSPRTAIRPLCEPKPDTNGVKYRKIPREFDSVKGRTIAPKTKPLEPFATPGPGEYSPRRSWNSGSGHKMSPKNGKEKLFKSWLTGWRSPGPAEYKSNDKTACASAPSFSLRDNCGPCFVTPPDTPGPDVYSQDRSSVQTRSPRFTIRPRCGNTDLPSPTKDAGYVMLNNIPHTKPAVHIRPREELELIPK